MRAQPVNILLADLCYERRSPSPLPVPYAVGLISSYLKRQLGPQVNVTIVRTIARFYEAIESRQFHVAGFSHYVWNANLSKTAATHLKSAQPSCVVVFGGPNLPIHRERQEWCVRALTCTDFFIEKEGEVPFANLVSALIDTDFDCDAVKELRLKSVRSVREGHFLTSAVDDRTLALDSIPSPYLEGLMDEFLYAGFTPMIENNRGAHFRATSAAKVTLTTTELAASRLIA